MGRFSLANCVTLIGGFCLSGKYLQKYGNYPLSVYKKRYCEEQLK